MAKKQERKAPPVERLSGIQDKKDRDEVVEAYFRAFSGPHWMEGHMERSLLRGPVYDPEHTRVAVADGRVVSAVTMAPRMMRFGPVTVPAMTLGPVGTHDRYRKRGYSAAAMNDASRYMEQNGYLLAYLQGISDFYYRFGYYPYIAPGNVKFNRDKAKKESRPGRLRTMRRKDLPVVRRIYDRATAARICAAARDKKVWDWLIGPGTRTWLFRKPKVIVDERGRPCGYLTVGGAPHQAAVGEIVVRRDEASCRTALGALVGEARRRESREITLPLPWDDALAVFVRQHVDAEWKMWSGSMGGAMLKVVDFPALLQRLEPLFAQRRREARSALQPVRFTMKCEIGQVGFRVSRGGVRVGPPVGRPVVRIPQRWLSGLLTGYHAVRHVAPRKGASVPADLMPVMEILFPTGWPFVYQGDNY